MSSPDRRQLLQKFVGDLLQVAGTVVVASKLAITTTSGADSNDGEAIPPREKVEERADRISSTFRPAAADADKEDCPEAMWFNTWRRLGTTPGTGFRNMGWPNGGWRNGSGFRNGWRRF